MVEISERVFRALALETMDAAIDAQRWPGLMRALAGACGGMGGLMFGCSLAQPSRSFLLNGGLDPDITQLFSERHQDNPWTRAGAAWRGDGAFDIQSLVERRMVMRSEFYADVVRPQGIRTMTAVNLPLGTGFDIAGVSLAFGAGDEGAPRSAVALLDAIAPFLRRAVGVSLHLNAAAAAAQGLAAALDAMPHAALLLAHDARIVFANRRAERLLAEGDGLRAGDGRLGAARPADARTLRRLVGQAAAATEGHPPDGPGAVAIARLSGRPPLSVLLTPVRDLREQMPLPGRPVAMLVVTDGDEQLASQPRAVARLEALFGLTPTESRVAVLVAQGQSGPEAAAALGIGPGTVHAHLKSVFAKTGVRRQSGLARLLTRTGVLDMD